MTSAEQREAARQFINRWRGHGNETQDCHSYWIQLLSNILGMKDVTERINFEKSVVIDGHSKRIDVYTRNKSYYRTEKFWYIFGPKDFKF